MNSGQRTAVSLLVSVALFTGFIFSVYSSVFNKIETRFYEPERINLEKTRIKESADFCNSYIQNLLDKTGEYAANEAVLSYLTQTPTESEVTERVRLSGELFVTLPALDGFRLLDKNARNLHYSSYSADIVKQQGTTRVYRNYTDIEKIEGESPFSLVSIAEDSIKPYKLSFNKAKNLINISVPVYDKLKIYRGNFVFYFRPLDLEHELVKSGNISVGESVSLFIAEDNLSAGLVTGLPNIGKELFELPVLDAWKQKTEGPASVLKGQDDRNWVALSDYSSEFIAYSGIYTRDFFVLPETVRILVLVCVFITLFLIVFLLFSFKIDDMVIIRSRIKKIQFAFVTEYLENKNSVDWNQVSAQIESRRDDLFRDVKKSLGRKGKKHEKQVDALLNKSWDEILSAIGSRSHYENQIAMNSASNAELKKMLEEVLSSSEIKVKALETRTVPVQSAVAVEPVEEVEGVEELGDTEEVEPVEELDDIEPVEDLGDVEEVEAVEELGDAEEVEALEELGDAEEVEVVEEFESVEELDDVEDFEDAESLELIEDAIDEVLEDAEVESVEELSDAEEVEAVEELDDVEPIEEAEIVEELNEVESVEEVEAEEEIESVEELADVDSVEKAENETTVELLEDVDDAEVPADLEDDSSEVQELIDTETAEVPEEIDIPVEELSEAEELLDVENAETVEELDAEELLEEAEEIEKTEPTETTDVATVDDGRDSIFKEPNVTFASSMEDSFATVENVFAEELRFGVSYILPPDQKLENDEVEMPVEFNLADPEFGDDEELIPVENKFNDFSMAGFGANNNNVVELVAEDSEEPIVEKDGVYSISESLDSSSVSLDKDFKKLVDAVMR